MKPHIYFLNLEVEVCAKSYVMHRTFDSGQRLFYLTELSLVMTLDCRFRCNTWWKRLVRDFKLDITRQFFKYFTIHILLSYVFFFSSFYIHCTVFRSVFFPCWLKVNWTDQHSLVSRHRSYELCRSSLGEQFQSCWRPLEGRGFHFHLYITLCIHSGRLHRWCDG